MVFRSRHAWSASLIVASLAVLAGCQPKSSVYAEPSKRIGQGTTKEETPGSDNTGTSTPGSDSTTAPSTGAPSVTEPTSAPTTATETAPADNNVPSTDSAGPVTLRIVLDKGQELKYKSTSQSESKFAGGTGKMPEMKPVTTTSETSVKVVDKTGDKAKVEMTVTNMSLTGGMAGDEAQKAMQKMAKETAGVKVSALFDAQGQPTNLKYEKGDRMQAVAAGIDSNTGFFGISYPEKAVNPGDTWTHDFDFKDAIGAFGPMKDATWANSMIVTKFTLKSVDRTAGVAIIAINASGTPSMTMKMNGFAPKGADKAKVPSDMKMSFKVNGSGTATVDLKTGLPKEVTYEMSTTFDSPMGGNMTQKVKANLKRQ